jgi:hypothetical protein
MKLSLSFPIHSIPLWFLILSLFLPRLCLIPIIVWVLLPRILILFWIYQDQGITIWLLLHLIALLCAWGGSGSRVVRRRRVDVID